MNNKRVRTKAMAMAVAAAMAVELCPVTAFAVTGEQVAADGTYTSTAQVNRDPAADVDDDWADYGVSVELTVKDGRFENITVTPDAAYSSGNDSYFNKAYNKSKAGNDRSIIGCRTGRDRRNHFAADNLTYRISGR